MWGKMWEGKKLKDFADGLRLNIGLKFVRCDFGEPGFFRRGEISASLNLDGKVAWVKDWFAKWEMRMEKVSAHDFRSDVGM